MEGVYHISPGTELREFDIDNIRSRNEQMEIIMYKVLEQLTEFNKRISALETEIKTRDEIWKKQ